MPDDRPWRDNGILNMYTCAEQALSLDDKPLWSFGFDGCFPNYMQPDALPMVNQPLEDACRKIDLNCYSGNAEPEICDLASLSKNL